MKITQMTVGMIGTNCYIVSSGKHCIIVDPGDDFNRISKELDQAGLVPEWILLTHGHYDHIGAVNELKEKYECQVVIGESDKEMLLDPKKSMGNGKRFLIEPYGTVKEGDVIEVSGEDGDLIFEVLETPGHTKGGVCYLCNGALFCGDTLFQGDCGRTDLYGGSWPEIQKSLQKLAKLPPETKVFPGHGPSSDIGTERVENRYMRPSDGDLSEW